MIPLSDIDIEKLKNISKLTLDDLRNPEIFGRLKELVEEIDTYYYIKEANYLLVDLVKLLDSNKELAQSEPQLYKDYQKLIVYLKFLALTSQSTSDTEELFRKHLLTAVAKKIDLKERLRLLFLINSDENTGYNIRRGVIKAMEANEEKISKENLAGGTSGLPVYPYVKNWLRDYISVFSAKKEARGELEQVTYLNQSKNIKKLNQEEKKILTGVIKLYDFLCFPAAEKEEVKATGHIPRIIPRTPKTEEINKTGNPAEPAAEKKLEKTIPPPAPPAGGFGRVSPTLPAQAGPFVKGEASKGENNAPRIKNEAEKNLDELKALAATYRPGSLERKAVEEEIERATRNS